MEGWDASGALVAIRHAIGRFFFPLSSHTPDILSHRGKKRGESAASELIPRGTRIIPGRCAAFTLKITSTMRAISSIARRLIARGIAPVGERKNRGRCFSIPLNTPYDSIVSKFPCPFSVFLSSPASPFISPVFRFLRLELVARQQKPRESDGAGNFGRYEKSGDSARHGESKYSQFYTRDKKYIPRSSATRAGISMHALH